MLLQPVLVGFILCILSVALSDTQVDDIFPCPHLGAEYLTMSDGEGGSNQRGAVLLTGTHTRTHTLHCVQTNVPHDLHPTACRLVPHLPGCTIMEKKQQNKTGQTYQWTSQILY